MWSRPTELSRYTVSDAGCAIYVSRADERNARSQSHYLCSYYDPGNVGWGLLMYSRICASLFGPTIRYDARAKSAKVPNSWQHGTWEIRNSVYRAHIYSRHGAKNSNWREGHSGVLANRSHTLRIQFARLTFLWVLRVLKRLQSATKRIDPPKTRLRVPPLS